MSVAHLSSKWGVIHFATSFAADRFDKWSHRLLLVGVVEMGL